MWESLTSGTMVWAKVRTDPWWPAVVLGPSPLQEDKGWMKKNKCKKKQYRCVFLQAMETYSWLDVKKIRPFRKEDTGLDRPADYITNVPRYKHSHAVAIQLGLRILRDPDNPRKYLLDETKQSDGNQCYSSEVQVPLPVKKRALKSVKETLDSSLGRSLPKGCLLENPVAEFEIRDLVEEKKLSETSSGLSKRKLPLAETGYGRLNRQKEGIIEKVKALKNTSGKKKIAQGGQADKTTHDIINNDAFASKYDTTIDKTTKYCEQNNGKKCVLPPCGHCMTCSNKSASTVTKGCQLRKCNRYQAVGTEDISLPPAREQSVPLVKLQKPKRRIIVENRVQCESTLGLEDSSDEEMNLVIDLDADTSGPYVETPSSVETEEPRPSSSTIATTRPERDMNSSPTVWNMERNYCKQVPDLPHINVSLTDSEEEDFEAMNPERNVGSIINSKDILSSKYDDNGYNKTKTTKTTSYKATSEVKNIGEFSSGAVTKGLNNNLSGLGSENYPEKIHFTQFSDYWDSQGNVPHSDATVRQTLEVEKPGIQSKNFSKGNKNEKLKSVLVVRSERHDVGNVLTRVEEMSSADEDNKDKHKQEIQKSVLPVEEIKVNLPKVRRLKDSSHTSRIVFKSEVCKKPLSVTAKDPLLGFSPTKVRMDTNFRIPKGKKDLSRTEKEGKMEFKTNFGKKRKNEKWLLNDIKSSPIVNSKDDFPSEKTRNGSFKELEEVSSKRKNKAKEGKNSALTRFNFSLNSNSLNRIKKISVESQKDYNHPKKVQSFIQRDFKKLEPKLLLQPLPLWVTKLSKDLFFDCHCHLDLLFVKHLPQMELESYDEVLNAFPTMRSLGGLITSFCQPSLWSSHLQPLSPLVISMLARANHSYTVGVHPNFASQLRNRSYIERFLRHLLSQPGVVGLGECGLDCLARAAMEDQIQVFTLQVKLAIQLKLPLVLYIRGAEVEALRVLDEVELPRSWPIHRQWCLGMESWSCWSPWLARFPNSVVGITLHAWEETKEVVGLLPLDKLVLQTDSPYSPHSSCYSLPVHVIQVAEKVAQLRNLSPETVLRASRDNVRKIYNV